MTGSAGFRGSSPAHDGLHDKVLQECAQEFRK